MTARGRSPAGGLIRHRGVLAVAAALGLLGGFVVSSVVAGYDPITRWALIPLAGASLGVMVGFVMAARAVATEAARHSPVRPSAVPPASLRDLGPDPWGRGRRETTALRPEVVDARAWSGEPELLSARPAEGNDSRIERLDVSMRSPADAAIGDGSAPSPDALRLSAPSEDHLEAARRAVAKIVADIAPVPGVFDAVCALLPATGARMTEVLAGLGRSSLMHEKRFGADLYRRLVATDVTDGGLDALAWLRSATEEIGGDVVDVGALFGSVSSTFSQVYGGDDGDWLEALTAPDPSAPSWGAGVAAALRVKQRPYTPRGADDREAVRRVLDTDQWM